MGVWIPGQATYFLKGWFPKFFSLHLIVTPSFLIILTTLYLFYSSTLTKVYSIWPSTFPFLFRHFFFPFRSQSLPLSSTNYCRSSQLGVILHPRIGNIFRGDILTHASDERENIISERLRVRFSLFLYRLYSAFNVRVSFVCSRFLAAILLWSGNRIRPP